MEENKLPPKESKKFPFKKREEKLEEGKNKERQRDT
jgi:hypothetical protein